MKKSIKALFVFLVIIHCQTELHGNDTLKVYVPYNPVIGKMTIYKFEGMTKIKDINFDKNNTDSFFLISNRDTFQEGQLIHFFVKFRKKGWLFSRRIYVSIRFHNDSEKPNLALYYDSRYKKKYCITPLWVNRILFI